VSLLLHSCPGIVRNGPISLMSWVDLLHFDDDHLFFFFFFLAQTDLELLLLLSAGIVACATTSDPGII
jgi:hypothetical protein